MNEPVIIGSVARFSFFGEGVLRMEYAPDGKFEERPSVHVIARPDPDLIQVERDGSVYVLRGQGVTVRYFPDGMPFSQSNLAVFAASGNLLWFPGKVDQENLGGVHTSMDCVQRGIIPRGVHSATTAYHENSNRWQLWSYVFGPGGATTPDAHYNGRLLTLEQLLALHPVESLPPHVQELVREREKYPPGLLSRSGYFLFNDSNSPVIDPVADWAADRGAPEKLDYYLFAYGRDYAKALRDYRRLFGPTPLLSRYSLGLWYSRYPTFQESRLRELVGEFAAHGLPLDVMVLDLEWHRHGWYGYEWDRNHIPDPEGFLAFLHEQGIFATLNLHPNSIPVEDARLEKFLCEAGIDPQTAESQTCEARGSRVFRGFEFGNRRHAEAFLNVFLRPVEKAGCDFWWIDGDVPCLSVPVEQQFWTNHVFYRDAEKNAPNRRPMIFSRSPGFGSHRYPFHFTGDTYSQWEVLHSQVEYTLRAGHMGLSSVTHDIGGHMHEFDYLDSEMYARWVQFGVLSPIVRLHSAGGGERIPWNYGEKVFESIRTALRLRMELLPYLYTLAHEAHATCLPICRSNCLANPDWEKGYDIWDSYYIGDRIYAAPIVTPGNFRKVTLPPGGWYFAQTGERISSNGTEPHSIVALVTDIPPHYYRAGKLIVKQPYAQRAASLPETLVVEIYADDFVSDFFDLYEDDGVSRAYRAGGSAVTRFSVTGTKDELTLEIGAVCGNFEGLLRQRRYEIRVVGWDGWKPVQLEPLPVHSIQQIHLRRTPSSVTINGR